MRRLRRTWILAGAGVLAAVFAFGISQAAANSTATAPIHYDDDSCGTGSSKIVGYATFDAKGGKVAVRVSLHGMLPGAYVVILYGNPSCVPLATLGKFKVDGSGQGEKSGSSSTYGYKRLFVVIRPVDSGSPISDSNSNEVKVG